MRFDKLFLAAAAVAVLTFIAGNHAQAQSGSRGIASSVVESFSPGGIVQGGGISSGGILGGVAQGGISQGGIVGGISQGGIAPFSSAPVQYSTGGAPVFDYAPAYGAAPGTYQAQVPVQTSGCHGCRGQGRAFTGQIHGGCRDCAKEAPIRTSQDYSAVPSCCGTLGQLDIPSLFTPPRYDRPPIGKAVGRPLFGQWQGY